MTQALGGAACGSCPVASAFACAFDMSGFTAIILAGGDSSRFSFGSGSGSNKVFASVGGVPLVARAVMPFVESSRFSSLIIVAKKDDFGRIRSILAEHCLKICLDPVFVESGATRALSSKNGIDCASEAGDSDFVLVSDAARCNVSVGLIGSVCDALCACDNAVPCLRHEETFKVVSDGLITETIKRSDMYEIQTPQGFRLSKIKQAYDGCFDASARDESEIYFRFHAKEKINMVQGSPCNFKVTRYCDLKQAEEILIRYGAL